MLLCNFSTDLFDLIGLPVIRRFVLSENPEFKNK